MGHNYIGVKVDQSPWLQGGVARVTAACWPSIHPPTASQDSITQCGKYSTSTAAQDSIGQCDKYSTSTATQDSITQCDKYSTSTAAQDSITRCDNYSNIRHQTVRQHPRHAVVPGTRSIVAPRSQHISDGVMGTLLRQLANRGSCRGGDRGRARWGGAWVAAAFWGFQFIHPQPPKTRSPSVANIAR